MEVWRYIIFRLRGLMRPPPPPQTQASFTRQGEDQGLVEVALIRVPVEAEVMPTKLRIDVGWSTWKKPKVGGGSRSGTWCVWGGLLSTKLCSDDG